VDRAEAIRKMSYALREIRCQGLITNQRFLLKLLENEHFIKGAYDTHFIANYIDVDTFLKLESEILCELSIALLMFRFDKRNQKRSLLQNITSGWRNNFYQMQHETIEAEGEQFKIEYKNIKENLFLLNIDGKAHEVRLENCSENEIRLSIDKIQKSYFIAESISNQYFVQHPSGGSCNLKIKDRYPEKEIEKIKGGYEAPMPGEIFKILVNSGQNVEEGTPLLILVSMKMENIITASETGIVQDVFVQVGETVQAGKLLLKLGQDNSN
jgi:acetyl/propionyl-CoA carboxylase alpha subunit